MPETARSCKHPVPDVWVLRCRNPAHVPFAPGLAARACYPRPFSLPRRLTVWRAVILPNIGVYIGDGVGHSKASAHPVRRFFRPEPKVVGSTRTSRTGLRSALRCEPRLGKPAFGEPKRTASGKQRLPRRGRRRTQAKTSEESVLRAVARGVKTNSYPEGGLKHGEVNSAFFFGVS